ncbi:hypothetical protein [Methanobrevibacter sp. DSM 116169]|uniref:hypothetical protein n=1 Tax=Methanobrevibacter sp. DSM 116169 TaxID=3242727 RepID=UPI0038FCBC1A
MPEFKLTKESGVNKFEILMAVDFDEDGNIENQEYYDGEEWSDNPADLRICSTLCDTDDQEEWNNFFNDFMYLLESDDLFNELKKLKTPEDSYFLIDEGIEVKLDDDESL